MERFNMPQILITILVTFFAGMGAGLGTGFAGMSAAAVISPMLITFFYIFITKFIVCQLN